MTYNEVIIMSTAVIVYRISCFNGAPGTACLLLRSDRFYAAVRVPEWCVVFVTKLNIVFVIL